MSLPRSTSRFSCRFGVALAVTGAVAIVTACGDSTAESCGKLASAAETEVAAVVAAHHSCTQASGCVNVGLNASCFDVCWGVMGNDGAAALMAAKDKVDQNQCAQFANRGCKFDVPPCVPPSTPACVAGECK